jgi:hypothetical protein
MDMTKLDIDINCPKCGKKLNIDEVVYRDENDLKDSDIEWSCPNNCLFEDEEIKMIDEKIDAWALSGRQL